jgi:hypothetical protein
MRAVVINVIFSIAGGGSGKLLELRGVNNGV